MTHKPLTRGHVAFDTSGLFWKIAVRLDSPYLQQIASIRKIPTQCKIVHTQCKIVHTQKYSTVDQVSACALSYLRFQYLLKCALIVSAHVLRFQYLLTYLVRTNFVPISLYRLVRTRLVRTPSKISILTELRTNC